jgi:hypothetical protein
VTGRFGKHTVFSIIRDSSNGPVPYPYSAPPGEKCGLGNFNAMQDGMDVIGGGGPVKAVTWPRGEVWRTSEAGMPPTGIPANGTA